MNATYARPQMVGLQSGLIARLTENRKRGKVQHRAVPGNEFKMSAMNSWDGQSINGAYAPSLALKNVRTDNPKRHSAQC